MVGGIPAGCSGASTTTSALHCPFAPRTGIFVYVREPETEITDDQFTSRMTLLRRVAEKMSMRDLVEEFTMLRVWPLQMGWNCVFEQGAKEWLKVYSDPPVSAGEFPL